MRSQRFDVGVYIDRNGVIVGFAAAKAIEFAATQTLVRLCKVKANQDFETYGGE
ncbi:hypothetical protein [Nostoc sp.]|uniref:hypothetical protein n=1 Tax=Nostoc sp. TaxID=1180 RepID=UPI002FFD4A38